MEFDLSDLIEGVTMISKVSLSNRVVPLQQGGARAGEHLAWIDLRVQHLPHH